MKAYLYFLYSKKKDRYYIGSSLDLARRLRQHNSGQTPTTKRFGKIKLVFMQEFPSLQAARQAEKKIKTWKRRDFIERIIEDGKMNSAS